MIGGWTETFLNGIKTLNEILAAGIAITAFALLLYALTFNLKDRVARSFAIILICLVIVYSAEAIGSVTGQDGETDFLLRLQWVGILFLPPAYLHFSDALLATTGKPSRGKRRWAIRIIYVAALILCAALPFSSLTGRTIFDQVTAPHLESTWVTYIYSLFYAGGLLLGWFNLIRAFERTTNSTSRRRMAYLLIGALGPALGSYPYLVVGSEVAGMFPLMFWVIATTSNMLIGGLVVLMAYAVAFFGSPWPDRIIKSRLFKWLLRGPFTAALALGITTILRRAIGTETNPYPGIVPIAMVATILVVEYTISFLWPVLERRFFDGSDQADLRLLRTLEERLLTENDLRQFMEMLLAAACDRLQSPSGFLAALSSGEIKYIVETGHNHLLRDPQVSKDLLEAVTGDALVDELFSWEGYYLIPLHDPTAANGNGLLGLFGIAHTPGQDLEEDQLTALSLLTERATMALRDRQLQQQVFRSMQDLNPQVEIIQRLRAAGRYNERGLLTSSAPEAEENIGQWVKAALTHYWGGPRLTESPLIRLQVVQQEMTGHDGNAPNALRAILRRAIDRVKPEGERRFTAEWILYNILEMKFMEGKMVREIALRLALSEADLYRKQRVAVEAVARAILDMEDESRQAASTREEIEAP